MQELPVDKTYLICLRLLRHFREYSEKRFCSGESNRDPASILKIHLAAVHIRDLLDWIGKFRKFTGMSPSEYAESIQALSEQKESP